MKNILMLTIANIRKRKSQSVTLLLFVLIATMLLNIGLILVLGIGSFFDERAEDNNVAHFATFYYADSNGIDDGRQFIKTYPGVKEIEELNVIGGYGEVIVGDVNTNYTLLISRITQNQKMDAPSMVGDSLPLIGDAIYVPNFMFINGDYSIGDNLKILLSELELNFTIAGVTEEIMFGDPMTAFIRFYISDEKYSEIEKHATDLLFPIVFISARLENISDSVFILAEYNRELSREDVFVTWVYDYAKQGRTMIPMIAAAVITVFASILLFVSLIVIRFRIINSIEEGMTNIGTQKAVGFRSVQIIMAIVMQFGGISLIGGIIGILLSQIAIPFIVDLLKPMIALIWEPGFNLSIAIIAISTVLVAVILISYLTSRRINKLHPLIALRGGITTHSFKRNPLPLEKSRVSLNLLLAVKQLLQNKKQAVTIIIIIAVVTMASVMGLASNYNMNEGQEGFVRAFFGEISEVIVLLKDGEDVDSYKERMAKRPEVRKILGYHGQGAGILVDEVQVFADVVEDTSLLEGNMLINGRYPRHNNEIALGTAASKITGKGTGDTVTIRIDESSKDYIITGIVQLMTNNGFNGIITEDALREVQPDYILNQFNIYLYDDTDVERFIESMKSSEGDIFVIVVNINEQMYKVLSGMGGIFAAISLGILGVTAFVVILVLYMIIKTTILRKRRELGIQKAVGFTTIQLMNQISLNMMPVILTGVILGGLTGYFGFNSMMGATLTGFGIVQVDLPAPLNQIILVCIALVALAYAVSMAIAWRIRRISAYALVSE